MNNAQLHEKIEFVNVREMLDWCAETHNAKTAYSFITEEKTKEIVKKSFTELREDVRALGTKMLQMGCHGKHCAVIGKFSYNWAVIYFASMSIGAVLVPLDKDWHTCDLVDTCENADIEFLFADTEISDKATEIGSQIKLLHSPITIGGTNENSVTQLIDEGKVLYNESPEAFYNARIFPDKLSLLVFTSGTTGKGKGVMLSQNAILSDLCDIIPYIDFGKKTVGVLPPHHTYGSSVMLIGHAIIGAEVYVSAGLRHLLKEFKEQKPEHLVLVPLYLETFYRRIKSTLKEKGKEETVNKLITLSNNMLKIGIDLRKNLFSSIRAAFGGEVKTIISGGAPLNPEILSFFEAIGISVLNGYGITECAPIVAVNRSKNVVPGSVGSVLNIDTVKISEPNENAEGEICVKGPNVMLGYYKNEEATLEAFDNDGYFKTGDYGKIDNNGILYITGRKKNIIILSNGKNVYPEEIENELIAIPGVSEVVVYEGKSARGITYNAIVAEIYPDKDYFEKNNIGDAKEYFKKYIDEYNKTAVSYKKIGLLRVRKEEFPKNTLRKIMRFKINTEIE